jgi:hypothetical protein
MTNTKRIWKKEEIRKLLETRDEAVLRGMCKIFELQTFDEQQSDSTNHDNGVGFTGADAMIMSSFVKFYHKRGFITLKQMMIARKKMLKYSGQLAKIVNGKIII